MGLAELVLTREPGGHSCELAARRSKLVAPGSVNGSVEAIFETGASRAAYVTGEWANKIAEAIPTTDDPLAIRAAIERALTEEDEAAFALHAHDATMHGVMLGALDSAYEAETNDAIKPEAFEPPIVAATRGGVLLAEVRYHAPGFDHLPYASAKQQFLDLNPVTRRVFDSLDSLAARNAFTIAGTTRKSVVKLVQRELARQISQGASLREFRKFAEQRLIKAGWTPANPSHVETIFRNSTQRAYSAGRVEHQMKPSVLKARPFWKVQGVGDGPPRERPWHAQHNGKVLRADNPIWREKYPPFGHNCRHTITTLPASYSGPVADDLADVPDKGFHGGVPNLLPGV